MELAYSPIARCVSDQEDEPFGAEISLLQGRLSLDGLQVHEASLGLDQDCPKDATDKAVAGTQITSDRHWHLGSPRQAWVQPLTEAPQQSELRLISHRVSVRMEGGSELQPNDGRDPGDDVDGQRGLVSFLDPLDPRRADANPPCHLAHA